MPTSRDLPDSRGPNIGALPESDNCRAGAVIFETLRDQMLVAATRRAHRNLLVLLTASALVLSNVTHCIAREVILAIKIYHSRQACNQVSSYERLEQWIGRIGVTTAIFCFGMSVACMCGEIHRAFLLDQKVWVQESRERQRGIIGPLTAGYLVLVVVIMLIALNELAWHVL